MPAAPLPTRDCALAPAEPRRPSAGGFGAGARGAAAIAMVLLLASCAGGPAEDTFDLSAARPAPARPLRGQLRVAEPLAAIDLDSESILVRTGRQEVATLAGAKWSDRLPLLVQSRLTQTFENANLSGQVGRRPATAADYDLDIDIRAFDLDAARSRVEADFAVKIVSAGSGRVVAAEIFTDEAPVASTNGAEVSAALDGALSSVMTRIVAFVARRL
ncbi:MAG: ABC-type transport auxiliary lipoprotein family protein [Roseiarcus sp.]|jgi:cholesterol transport system auxiliary component